jgi:ribosomal protein S18 acetylase RimI-like enzyme
VTPEAVDAIGAFERELMRRTSTTVAPFPHGTVYLNAGFPLRWDSNALWVERGSPRTSAPELAGEADRILGGAGLAHREVFVEDDAEGARLAPGFRSLRWSADHVVAMAHRGRQTRTAPGVAVREASFEGARPLLEEVVGRAPYGGSAEVVRQLVEHRAMLERAVGARFFVGERDGIAAGICELYTIGDVAQVEDVNTLEEHRGRGVATAVVLAAVDAARAAGARIVFLLADDDDWPKGLYRNLGFREVDRRWSFLLVPP